MKIYIIVKKNLEMPPAKLAVQVGHGVEAIIRLISYNFMKLEKDDPVLVETKRRWQLYNDAYVPKIILETTTDEMFETAVKDLMGYAGPNSVPAHVVEDQGFTFFDKPTVTAFAFGPATQGELGRQKRLRLYEAN